MKTLGIIGGGASGLAAAIAAKRKNPSLDIFILEQKELLGKKLLVTGNGRCNLTNERQSIDCYRSENPAFAAEAFSCFGYEQTLAFLHSCGIFTKNKQGYIYPRSETAASVREQIESQVHRLGIQVHLSEKVTSIRKEDGIFHLETVNAQGKPMHRYQFDRVILTSGGRAMPSQGSDGSGYKLAKSFGHTYTTVVPALVQLRVKNSPLKAAAGVRLHAQIRLFVGQEEMAFDEGELQLTEYGISGIPVFQVSRFASLGLFQKKSVSAKLDFMPELSAKELFEYLKSRAFELIGEKADHLLKSLFPEKLIPVLLKSANLQEQLIRKDFDASLKNLTAKIKSFEISISDSNGFQNAQVTAGGIDTREISAVSMESRLTKGLYFAGEILDVDGICGGYNLQWAWTSGNLAGIAASQSK